MKQHEIDIEIDRRRKEERRKALEKYGANALQPGGRPEFDILDYLINEVIGLDRYGEMVTERFSEDEVMVDLGNMMRQASRNFAVPLIRERNRLLKNGKLGRTEVR